MDSSYYTVPVTVQNGSCWNSPFMCAVRPCRVQLDAHHPQGFPGSLLARLDMQYTAGTGCEGFRGLGGHTLLPQLRRNGRPSEWFTG